MMQRRKFIKNCGYTAIGLPILGSVLHGCNAIYFASTVPNENGFTLSKSEFWYLKNDKEIERKFVMIQSEKFQYPICIYKIDTDTFMASLLECTHRGCELNVGGGIFSCPCHGSEFTNQGKLLTGPAERDLKTFETKSDEEKIYVKIS